jgi:hypothetical protein
LVRPHRDWCIMYLTLTTSLVRLEEDGGTFLQYI